MRLDKYLKTARIIKRRSMGNALAKADLITVNKKIAKASLQLKPEDIISVRFGHRLLTIKVLSTQAPKSKSDELMYEIIESVILEDEN